MPILDQTDYSTLSLGHPPVSRKELHIVGLELRVYGLEEIKDSNLPIACIIATHGRGNNMDQMEPFAQGVLGEINKLKQEDPPEESPEKDVILVLLEQRNHGKRLHDPVNNQAYDKNPTHLCDMAAMIVGGCQDVSFVIDFLASYLFPNGERDIVDWIATGISLGGNVTWRLLLEEPRIQFGVPLIGLPFTSLVRYLGARATKSGLSFSPPIYPPALRAIIEKPFDANPYYGKKILSLHGQLDTLVPHSAGVEDFKRIESDREIIIKTQGNVRHAVSPDMVVKVAEWVNYWVLSPQFFGLPSFTSGENGG
ncbi:hypothetical protein M231_04220 [Tremella mesenterica]|uniref:Peptidase S9 prolyl oligopeptidase catalytic domain-containing protein n=1 Tax=Tremella mesenterica TaxID=5217 RepID=A0A4Q1BL04_TREME|nr:hypothetical protein M231_04220 [Tremella mesenterica]